MNIEPHVAALVPAPAPAELLTDSNAFDELTQLAAQVCEAPVAAISVFSGERVWFMASFGHRLGSITGHAAEIVHALPTFEETLVVENTLADARFAAHPLVTHAPHIRSYAGAAIGAPGDRPFGCVCVMDHSARAFTPHQTDALRVLARQIGTQLQLRRMQSELASETARRESLERRLTSYQSRLDEALVRLNSESTIDALTGLPNQRAFDARIDEEAYRARRYDLPISLLLLGIDRFERYQSSRGHDSGNALLQQLARHLRGTLRQSDVLSRYATRSLAVIAPNTGFDGACALAERIANSVASADWANNEITLSIGLSSQASHGVDAAALLVEATQALQAAVEAGGNRRVHFTNLT